MESRLLTRDVVQTSRKRAITGGRSDDPDVVVISPLINRISESKFHKIKKVMNHEIIDVDMDRDHVNVMHIEGNGHKYNKGMLLKHEIIDVDMNEDYDNIMVIEGKANKHAKGKEAMTIRSQVTSGNMDGGFVDGGRSSKKRCAPGLDSVIDLDGGCDLYYVDEDTYNEHQFSGDEHEHSPYISNDVATGASFKDLTSRFPGPFKNKTMVTTTSNSTESVSKPEPDFGGLQLELEASNALRNEKFTRKKSNRSSLPVGTPHHSVNFHKAGLFPSWSSADTASRKKVGAASKYLDSKSQYHDGYRKKRSLSGSTRSYSLPNRLNNSDFKASFGSYSSSHMHNVERATVLPNWFPRNRYSMETDFLASQENPMDLEKNVNSFVFQNNLLRHSNHYEQHPLQVHSSNEEMLSVKVCGLEKDVNENEVLKKLNLFKNFDIVQDPSDHHYVHSKSSLGQPSRSWLKRIQEEWNILEKNLPDSIFVRAYESRMDLLRAVIVGAEGTPYHNGLFFFDVFFPSNYPHERPCMYYHSWGLGVNPSLEGCGTVCLGLVNSDPDAFSFPCTSESTMLQVLVSIQGLILTANPYSYTFHVYEDEEEDEEDVLRKQEERCNWLALSGTLQTMAYTMMRPPNHFKEFVVGHFYTHAQDILVAYKVSMDTERAGRTFAGGGALDVYKGDKSCSCSSLFKLDDTIPIVVRALAQIGVEDCKQFIRQVKAGGDVAENKRRQIVLRNHKMLRNLVADMERCKTLNKQFVESEINQER